jgi:lipopolysaccharide heptosyltransferase II
VISRIELLKITDALLGRLVAYLLPRSGVTVPVTDIRRILIIRPGGIGDAVLLAPALVALRARYPGATITVMAERRNAAIFDLCPVPDRVLRYDVPRELRTALRGRYDLVIDTEQWHRLSAVVARLASSPVRIGYATNERSRLFTHLIAYSHEDYEVTSFFRILAPLGIETPETVPVPFLSLPRKAREESAVLLGSVAERDYQVIFPGASIPLRRWGAKRFRELARLLELDGRTIVVVGGEMDIVDAETIAGKTGLNLAGRSSLAGTAAIIAGASLLISGDSGLLHMAVGLGTATVSLFGPGRQRKWGPRGSGDLVINHRVDCSPCTTFGSTPSCKYMVRCMEEITVEEVHRMVQGFYSEKNKESATKILTLFR